NADNTVTYTPAANWYGTDGFTYTLTNGFGGTATAPVTVTVTAVNDRPTANNVNVATNQNVPVVVTLYGSDVEGSRLLFAIDAGPSHGTLSEMSGNTLTYVPAGNFSGTDSFTYYANDGSLSGASATVGITVNPVTLSPG